MVGVHQLQALLASHDASAVSQVLNWLHWRQTLLAAAIAIFISWMSLLAGFHHKGRPFGSRKAKIDTIILIIATTAVACLLSVFVPRLPFSMGIFIPAILSAAVLKENETITELRTASPYLAAGVTLTISYFYGRVKDQIYGDRGDWCDGQIEQLKSKDRNGTEDEPATLGRFAAAGEALRNLLINRLGDDQKEKAQVEDHFSVIRPAVRQAADAERRYDLDSFGEYYSEARQALFLLLQIAYNWKYPVDLTGALNPSDRFKGSPNPPARARRPSNEPQGLRRGDRPG